mmetsp:Transcript_22621/g.49564  ORF Transcript_22621/g.49564 Transcript_22621/m.49564 type:complete len:383 (-) Transcript_22621:242-1390(-)|eukprot:CAMPEP_0204270182 /NCGR_PEP_ID=MMETSP0468-20130131/18408_1 /ASSEMBLY_ACC=CAM_ASM_000383 /TAXON_ID=2969 /ORGANISM="Oxyrrhis marina" /LENGTH=382 /DNA_ID=CAMNT_0051245681 /DNA_START=31 /DNA_END=1179 /DNA_ORIENTATION=-
MTQVARTSGCPRASPEPPTLDAAPRQPLRQVARASGMPVGLVASGPVPVRGGGYPVQAVAQPVQRVVLGQSGQVTQSRSGSVVQVTQGQPVGSRPSGVVVPGQQSRLTASQGATKIVVGTASMPFSGAPPPVMRPQQVQASGVPPPTGAASSWSLKGTRLLQMEFNFKGDFKIRGEPLQMEVDHPTARDETGLRVWDAGVVLSKALEYKLKEWVPNKPSPVVVDLGCGSGITSIAAALVGAQVYATDREIIRERTERNVANNVAAIARNGGSCEFKVLDWLTLPQGIESLPPCPDLLIASDVIWDKSFIDPFLKALQHAGRDSNPRIVMGHKQRSEELDAQFFDAANKAGFEVVQTLLSTEVIPETKFHHELVSIYIMQRRA